MTEVSINVQLSNLGRFRMYTLDCQWGEDCDWYCAGVVVDDLSAQIYSTQ